MSTQTLQRPRLFPLFPARRPAKPFLEALRQAEYGQLTMITPEGERLEFTGAKLGPSAHMRLYDWKALEALIARGEIGFADAYIDRKWDSNDLPALLTYGLQNTESLEHFFHGRPLYALWVTLCNRLSPNSVSGSRRNIMAHYDLGNDFYSLWLDKSMTYSCALFEGDASRSLEEAQQAKYHRILGKLAASPGEHILEIGCGWGGFAEAAAKAGLRVTAITLSLEQADYARERIKCAGLDHLATIKLIDYREVKQCFDHIVSIGMFEHVGEKYWPVYFDCVKHCLKPGGKAMIQSITLDDRLFETLHDYTGFIEYYIFPGGMLPSKSRFRAAAEKAGLRCKEIFGFGQDYARTLRHWLQRFDAHADTIRALGYDEPFMRLWRFYLASCIASFDSRRTDVMQAEVMHG